MALGYNVGNVPVAFPVFTKPFLGNYTVKSKTFSSNLFLTNSLQAKIL